MKHLILFLLASLVLSCNSLNDSNDYVAEANVGVNEELMQAENFFEFSLGSDKVKLKLHETPLSPILYFSLHDDENTAVGAIESLLDCNFNGRFLELNQNDKRLVVFNFKEAVYKFDPNRIFSKIGTKATLEKYGNYSDEAAEIVNDFAGFITDSLLKNVEIIVAIHNNGENEYSILDYQKGGKYENDAQMVFINETEDVDNFFYVTDSLFFNFYKKNGYNVLLQNNKNVTDDGSLSVFCGYKQIKYINIEAQSGSLEKNIEMIKFTNKILTDSVYFQ